MANFLKKTLSWLLHFVRRPWFPFAVAFLAGLDLFILVIPTDGLTISAVFAKPRQWFWTAVTIATGSMLGCALLSGLVYHNPQVITELFPHVFHSPYWIKTADYIRDYGLWAVFLGSASPLALQPFVVFGPLAGLPQGEFLLTLFAGRFLKFLVVSYITSHAPHLLGKMWGLQKDLKELEDLNQPKP